MPKTDVDHLPRPRIEYDHKHSGERVRFYDYRATSNLSRTLRTMERYNLVRLEAGPRRLAPRVDYDGVEFALDFNANSDRRLPASSGGLLPAWLATPLQRRSGRKNSWRTGTPWRIRGASRAPGRGHGLQPTAHAALHAVSHL